MGFHVVMGNGRARIVQGFAHLGAKSGVMGFRIGRELERQGAFLGDAEAFYESKRRQIKRVRPLNAMLKGDREYL
jgi:hypothetical protein